MLRLKRVFKSLYSGLIFSASANNSWLIKFYHLYLYNPRKHSLAYFYDQLSRNQSDIFVVQVGANDGITHDPIHKFIKRDGWNGLLLEPQPYVFRNKLFPLYLKNNGISLENVALGESIGLMDMYKVSFTNDRWATGLSTFHLPSIEKKIDNGEIKRLAKKHGVKLPVETSEYIDNLKVEVKTFDFLFEKYAIDEIDILQVDAEGFDFEIIKMFDLSRNSAKVVVFEYSHINDSEFTEVVVPYFEEHGYRIKKCKADAIAVSNDFPLGIRLLSEI